MTAHDMKEMLAIQQGQIELLSVTVRQLRDKLGKQYQPNDADLKVMDISIKRTTRSIKLSKSLLDK